MIQFLLVLLKGSIEKIKDPKMALVIVLLLLGIGYLVIELNKSNYKNEQQIINEKKELSQRLVDCELEIKALRASKDSLAIKVFEFRLEFEIFKKQMGL